MRHYLWVSDCSGALFDTRDAAWSKLPPLRANYARHHRQIETVADLKATLRAGGFAWPGGYALYFITSDGAALSFEAVQAQFRSAAWSIRNGVNDGWRVVACVSTAEDDEEVICDHTGKPIA